MTNHLHDKEHALSDLQGQNTALRESIQTLPSGAGDAARIASLKDEVRLVAPCTMHTHLLHACPPASTARQDHRAFAFGAPASRQAIDDGERL